MKVQKKIEKDTVKNQKLYLHLDMDAFFAQVEQRDFPEFRGKPVIIGPNPHAGELRGVVSTASYEARKFGVHSAMPISQAFKLCPHGIFVHGRHEVYHEASEKIFEAMKTVSPQIEPLSIDEAFLEIGGSLQLFGSVDAIVAHLKKKCLLEHS
jgi:nucleotidyltransferase/DNA polymerase involved in DNA repair